MDCKRLNAKLIQKEYWTQILQKKYFANDMGKYFNVKWWETKGYTVVENQKKYGVCYCVKYRPIWLAEWILARWWWNDKGIWTEDWIFNDWIL